MDVSTQAGRLEAIQETSVGKRLAGLVPMCSGDPSLSCDQRFQYVECMHANRAASASGNTAWDGG